MYATELLGFSGGIITTVAGIPQIYQMARTKKTQDLNWSMIIMWIIGLSLSCAYGVLMKATPIYVCNTVSLLQTLVMMALKLQYECHAPQHPHPRQCQQDREPDSELQLLIER